MPPRTLHPRAALVPLIATVLVAPSIALGADPVQVLEVRVDRPTLHALGVQVLIDGDDDGDATASVRVRTTDGGAFRDAPSLLRVRPETVTMPIDRQLAGSVLDLAPGTEVEIEISIEDPDGGGEVRTVTAATRPLPPAEPARPRLVPVASPAELTAALGAAQPGDVIELADGTYPGSFFSLNASGTAEQPIVVRGQSQAGAVIDGEGCTGCNVIEVYGSHVVIERLTIRAAERALRFQGEGTTGNVARRITIRDVIHGIGSRPDQTDFTICDNDVEGRLVWPWTFADDATSHWDDRGIEVTGEGHVVCHNRIVGFGDPVVNKKTQSRAWDVIGNDIRSAYDGTELDDSQGNVRLLANRFVDVMDPVSIQPVRGGPAYVLRNVAFNVPEEQIKLKSLGGVDEPSGVIIAHNTFISPTIALNMQTPITQHNGVLRNNLFVGPEVVAGRAVEWTAALDGLTFDADGYFPDGGFWLGVVGGENQVYDSWAELQAAGAVEANGVLLTRPIFEGDVVGPTDPQAAHEPPSFALAPGSNAIDAGVVLVGIDGSAPGAAPDLGAVELGCPTMVFGPRAAGDQAVSRIDCSEGQGGGSGAGGGSTGPGPGPGAGGGPGSGGGGPGAGPGSSGSSPSGTSGAGIPAAVGAGGGDGASGGGDDGCGCRVVGAAPSGERAGGLALIGLLIAGALSRRSGRLASRRTPDRARPRCS